MELTDITMLIQRPNRTAPMNALELSGAPLGSSDRDHIIWFGDWPACSLAAVSDVWAGAVETLTQHLHVAEERSDFGTKSLQANNNALTRTGRI